MNLKGKIALITGGSSGIGKAICVDLVKEGCKVIFTYNENEKGADETLKLLGKDSYKFRVNLQKEEEIENLFRFVKEKFGSLDILVNNAGVEVLSESQFNIESWKKTFDINLFSMVNITSRSLELIKSGKILNISSGYGEEKMGYPNSIAYSVSKASVNSLTRTLAKKLAPDVCVNAIAPGYVDTPMWGNTSEADKKVFGKDQLIERFINPEEIADMAISVIKNDAITGEVVVVDGGLSLKTI